MTRTALWCLLFSLSCDRADATADAGETQHVCNFVGYCNGTMVDESAAECPAAPPMVDAPCSLPSLPYGECYYCEPGQRERSWGPTEWYECSAGRWIMQSSWFACE